MSAINTYQDLYYTTDKSQKFEVRPLAGSFPLGTLNTTEFTPTGNYHPATKKYVDDTVNAAKPDITEADDADIEALFTETE